MSEPEELVSHSEKNTCARGSSATEAANADLAAARTCGRGSLVSPVRRTSNRFVQWTRCKPILAISHPVAVTAPDLAASAADPCNIGTTNLYKDSHLLCIAGTTNVGLTVLRIVLESYFKPAANLPERITASMRPS